MRQSQPTLYHKLQLRLWVVPEKMLHNLHFFKYCKMQLQFFYSVLILLCTFFQRHVGFTASIASCNLKLINTLSWQGAHFLVPRMILCLWLELNLDLVSINAYTKLDKILSICSQDIKRKRNYDGRNDRQPKSSITPLFQSMAININSIMWYFTR